MEVGKLTANLRTETGKGAARRLRKQGLIPGICYGPNLDTPLSITLDPKALKASLDPLKRQNTVIDVLVKHGDTTDANVTVMLKEYQIDPIHRGVTHVDLVAIEPNKTIDVEIPVEVYGKSIGVVEGGRLHVVRHSVHVTCKPADIPTKFELDVTALAIGNILRVGDIAYPEGVKPAEDPKSPIVTCLAAAEDSKAEATAETVETADAGDKPAEKKEEKKK